jgi:hypothetical protein
MLARRVAAGVAGSLGGARRLSAAAPAGNWVVSPAASTLLASNPAIDVKALAAKCALHSPGSGKVVITKVGVTAARMGWRCFSRLPFPRGVHASATSPWCKLSEHCGRRRLSSAATMR